MSMIQFIGVGNVLRNIAMWRNKKVDNAVRDALNKTRFKIETTAKNKAPVDTGRLRASIYSKMNGDLSAIVGDGVQYGIYLEKGTRNQKPQPFLIPAVQAHKGEFETNLKRVF